MRNIVFYHSADLDGHCSAAVAYDVLKEQEPELITLAINYGYDFPYDIIDPSDTVYMLDFCLEPFEDMIELNKKCQLIWIDHHKSVIEESEKHSEVFIKGSREIGKAGCELTWEYLHEQDELPMPKGVYFLGRYDVWDLSNPDFMKFQYGMRLHDTFKPNAPVWEKILTDDEHFIQFCLQSGEIVLAYQGQLNAKYINSYGFEIEFEGHRTIACNKGFTNSQLFDSVAEEGYDILLTFVRMKRGGWTISLYTTKDDVDVGEIAKSKGGGGHKQAAGFQTEELPF